ncbi:glycosyltransferase [Candidatus Dependentiae bacterium]|nr:glycosyltransferase [Candidatus Dependentiae bacterium]
MKTEKLEVPFGFYKTEFVSFDPIYKIDQNKPAILTLNSPFKFDGLVMHALSHYKAHLKEGYDTYILLPKGSELEKKLIEEKLPYYRFTQSNIFRNHRQPGMKRIIEAIVKKHNIKIIHCNRHKEIRMLERIKNMDVKIILTRHSPSALKTKYLKQFNTMFCVDQNCINRINTKCNDKKIKAPKIKHLAPFFDEKESLNFKPTIENRKEFFKKEFGIDLPDYPTIAMVACLRGYKNHQLMFKAVEKLVHKKNKPINLLLCGQGYKEKYLRDLAKQLKIDKYIHFLGFTYKRIEVMYHSDIKALTTKDEAFGIVLMEAALIKKPLLGPTKTGVVNTIKHQKTGLLFENGNVYDLVEKLEKLIGNPELRKEYGQNAYEHVKNNFLSDVLIKSVENFYKEIM